MTPCRESCLFGLRYAPIVYSLFVSVYLVRGAFKYMNNKNVDQSGQHQCYSLLGKSDESITETCPCNIQQLFTALKKIIFR